MEKKTEVKRKKPQGKINPFIVAKGLLAGKKKKDIAIEAGSLATSVENRCKAVNRVERSGKFQKLLEKFLPDNLLLAKHKEGLEATKVETVYDDSSEDGERAQITVPDYAVRHKYLDLAYKVKDKLPKNAPPPPQGDTRILNIGTLINAPR